MLKKRKESKDEGQRREGGTRVDSTPRSRYALSPPLETSAYHPARTPPVKGVTGTRRCAPTFAMSGIVMTLMHTCLSSTLTLDHWQGEGGVVERRGAAAR